MSVMVAAMLWKKGTTSIYTSQAPGVPVGTGKGLAYQLGADAAFKNTSERESQLGDDGANVEYRDAGGAQVGEDWAA